MRVVVVEKNAAGVLGVNDRGSKAVEVGRDEEERHLQQFADAMMDV